MLSYRKPNESDCLLYFDWANDLSVRKQSFDSDLINLENHKQMPSSIMHKKNSSMTAVMMNHNGLQQNN